MGERSIRSAIATTVVPSSAAMSARGSSVSRRREMREEREWG